MKDLTNKRFNRLTCIKPVGRSKSRLVIWECRCDCGNVKNISSEKLRHGTKSCGCLKLENLKNNGGRDSKRWRGCGDLSLSIFGRLKAGAKIRGYPFEVNIEYLWNLYLNQNKKCAISNRDMYLPVHSRPNDNKPPNENSWMASLDRINNNLGYIEGNVRWVCKELNYMKYTMTDEEFLEWIKVIYENKKLNYS